MCLDPVSMMIAGTAISSAGQIVGGISSYQTGKANAAQLNQQAALREEKAKVDIETADRNQRRHMGQKLANIGSSGVDARSFLDVISDDLAEGALEKQKIKFGGTVDANNLRFQAKMAKEQGKAALIGSIFSAAGTATAGYGKVTAYGMKSGSSSEQDI